MLYDQMGFQSGSLWLSALTGLGLAVVYDGIRCLRMLMTGRKRHNFWIDLCFGLFCGVVTELLALAAAFGRVRFYVVGAEIFAAVCYYLTIGRGTIRCVAWIRYRIVKIGIAMGKRLQRPGAVVRDRFLSIRNLLLSPLRKIPENIRKIKKTP